MPLLLFPFLMPCSKIASLPPFSASLLVFPVLFNRSTAPVKDGRGEVWPRVPSMELLADKLAERGQQLPFSGRLFQGLPQWSFQASPFPGQLPCGVWEKRGHKDPTLAISAYSGTTLCTHSPKIPAGLTEALNWVSFSVCWEDAERTRLLLDWLIDCVCVRVCVFELDHIHQDHRDSTTPDCVAPSLESRLELDLQNLHF